MREEPMTQLTVTYYEEHTIPLVHFPERVTMANAMAIQEELRLITMGGTKFIADFAGTSIVDSSGLAVLVRHREFISSVLSPQPNVLSLLELTRLTEILTITTNVKDAMSVYKQ